ncbi:MAG: (Fe-S)-binding protein, partial [Deltaproteobacteria bacterium]|nr:(Fe-S)-binding protein [Deltaproteobacteria bacterium]
MKATLIRPQDISKPSKRLAQIRAEDLPPLPPPYEDFNQKNLTELGEEKTANVEASLDGTIAIGIPKPKTKEEEEKYLQAFLSGLRKLFEKENNWTFLHPLLLSMDHCAKCQTCSDACP